MKNTITLCRLDEIRDPGSRGSRIDTPGGPGEIMLIRRDGDVYGYVNSCPHTGVCLDWQPGEFLTADRRRIICATHGAEFRIEDGYCLAGPCAGDQLEAVPITVDVEGRVVYHPETETEPQK